MATFQKVKLGAVTTNTTDDKHGDCTNEYNSGYYFISLNNVFSGSVHYTNVRQITEPEFIDTHRRTKLEIGDILITNNCAIRRMALIN
jgi:type I restriction enzyme S subunit